MLTPFLRSFLCYAAGEVLAIVDRQRRPSAELARR